MNDEDIPFGFSFEDNSRFAAGHLSKLKIDPMKGNIPPKSKYESLVHSFNFDCTETCLFILSRKSFNPSCTVSLVVPATA